MKVAQTMTDGRAEMSSSSGGTMLDLVGVQKTYAGKRSFEAIRDVTLSVRAGEFVCIVGPSGAGKTTLLRSIAGLQSISGGEVRLEGSRVDGPPEGMAVVFQEYARSLFPWMTVRQNMALPLKQKGLSRHDIDAHVAEALEAVGLSEEHDSYPWQLSGGMQQRVAIARAVAYEPKVLLMDEPFAAVDAQTRADLEDLVLALWKRLGVTVIFVTHDIDESVYLGQRVIVLSNSPTEPLEDLAVDLPSERDQLTTRMLPRFTELRAHVYGQIQASKAGARPGDVQP